MYGTLPANAAALKPTSALRRVILVLPIILFPPLPLRRRSEPSTTEPLPLIIRANFAIAELHIAHSSVDDVAIVSEARSALLRRVDMDASAATRILPGCRQGAQPDARGGGAWSGSTHPHQEHPRTGGRVGREAVPASAARRRPDQLRDVPASPRADPECPVARRGQGTALASGRHVRYGFHRCRAGMAEAATCR